MAAVGVIVRAVAKACSRPVGLAVIVIGLTASPVHPTVHTDSNKARTNTWVFGRFDCGCPPCDVSCPLPQAFGLDLFIAYKTSPLRYVLFTPYGGRLIGNVSIFSLTRAPDTGYVPDIDPLTTGEVGVGLSYALMTKEGKYVLFSIYELNPIGPKLGFVYRYQDDGSILFPAYTPSELPTWGSIKRLLSDQQGASRPR